jgi:hypothetical protein
VLSFSIVVPTITENTTATDEKAILYVKNISISGQCEKHGNIMCLPDISHIMQWQIHGYTNMMENQLHSGYKNYMHYNIHDEYSVKTAYIEYGKNEKNKINLPGMP